MSEQIAGEVDRSEYLARLEEINQTWRIVDDPKTGHKFEIATVNTDFLSKDAVLFPSTEYSSLTQNVGNAVELAASGADKPHVGIVYVASFGNGGTGSMGRADRRYFAHTGRFTQGTSGHGFQALDSVKAMSRAIEHHVGVPNHVSADVAGARLALGLMAAFDVNAIKGSYLNSPPGVSSRAKYSAVDSLSEDVRDRITRRQQSVSKPGEVVPDANKEAKEHLPRIYEAKGHSKLWLATYARAIGSTVITNRRGLSGHDDLNDLDNHALYMDTLAALGRQAATIEMEFHTESKAHNTEDCELFGEIINGKLQNEQKTDRRVNIILSSGGLDENTLKPGNRLVAERRALRHSIAQFMIRTILGGEQTTTDASNAPLRLAA
jgi:hypothetical protein